METLHVLVCDDEPGMRHSIVRALAKYVVEGPDFNGGMCFELTEAATGEDALRTVQEERPDILLLDMKLPGISGLNVLEIIAAQSLPVLTIMITAYASIETAVRATKHGAFDFLPKPFTPGELRGAVRRAASHVLLERQAREFAETKKRVRFEFLSVLAHELKAPINAVDGYLNLLQNNGVQLEPAQYEAILARCARRIAGMRKLIDDLLDLTRIESGQKPRTLASVALADIGRRALNTVRPDADARGVRLHLECPEDLHIVADAGEIEIMLNNLLSNAVKYNRDDGDIWLRMAVASDGRISIAVRDTGIGIRKEDLPRLFKEFTRIKNEKTEGVLGSGLGLSIVRKIAQLYDGNASVESELDCGSTFRVDLRAAVASPVESGSDAAAAAQGAS